jgi:hypothetical protein
VPAEKIYQSSSSPETTVIIPSLDGMRGGNVQRLVSQFKEQSYGNIEIILALNEKPNGHARNVGLTKAAASSRYYAFFDDDVTLGHNRVLADLLETLQDPKIGLAGVSQLPPPGSSWKQKWIGYDLGKAKFPVQKHLVDTEMATHAGMACRREVWEEMGGESDTLVTGTDTDLRERLRAAGYRVVVTPHTWVFHPLPDAFSKILKAASRNGWHQWDYRQVHGYQRGLGKPFKRVDGLLDLTVALSRELVLFLPHIFLANRNPPLGFRPLNAIFRLLMVGSYSLRAYREGRG